MTKIKREIMRFMIDKLNERFARLTEKQRIMFNKVFINGVSNSELEKAIELCDRTLDKVDKTL